MKIKKITDNKVLLYSLILAFLVLLIVPLIRFFYYGNLLVGEESYYHIRIAQIILNKGIPKNDPLIDSPYLFQPFHLILAGSFFLLEPQVSIFLLPFLLGLLSVLFFYLILKELNIKTFNKFFILLILIFSPVFIFTFSTLNSYSLSVFILLLAFLFFIKKKKSFFFRKRLNRRKRIYFILSLLFFALTPFLGILPLLFGISLIFIYSLNYKKELKSFYNLLFVSIIIALIRYCIYLVKYRLPYFSFNSNVLVNYLSELGGKISFSIFNLILAAIGFYILWNKKKQILGYTLLFIAIILSFYFNSFNIYINFLFAIAAGYAFVSFLKMHYSLPVIKKLTIALLLFGLLFSTISYIARISNYLPDSSVADSLEWLKANSKPGEVVFSHYTKGNWIQTIADRPVLLNSNLMYINDVKTKLNDSEIIFYSRNLKKTISLLEHYDISYIWINPEMKKGEVWAEEEEGLLFLFSNKDEFRKIYSKEGIEIWEVKK